MVGIKILCRPKYIKMKKRKVIIDYRTQAQTVKSLSELGFEVIKTTQLKSLYKEVDGHSDMQLHITDEGIICEPTLLDYYKKFLPEYNITAGQTVLNGKYPEDIAYNVCRLGKYVICNKAFAEQKIIDYYTIRGFEFINIKQGYAKCNICVVGNEAVITSDNGIYNTLKNKNLDVLKIRQGCISLYDMSGFIGGATGLLSDSLLAFNGDIKCHPDSENIISFCRNVGVDVISLSDGQLEDIGSIFVV